MATSLVASLGRTAADLRTTAPTLTPADAAAALQLCSEIITLLRPHASHVDRHMHKRSPVTATTEPFGLCSLPPDVLARIISLLPSTEDVGRLDCVSRAFHPKPPGSVLEEGLRLRAMQRGHSVAMMLPAGQWSWVQALCWDERRRRYGGHGVVADGNACLSAFVDAAGRLLTCGTEDEEEDHGGFLGHGEHVHELLTPTAIDGTSAVAMSSVAAGHDHILALSEGGAVYSFGYGGSGAHGHGNEDQHSPAVIKALQGVRFCGIAAGMCYSLAVSEAGAVYSFGCGDSGALGHGHELDQHIPKIIAWPQQGVRICAVSAGDGHSLTLSEEGVVYSFGCGENGKLGHGNQKDYHAPTCIKALKHVRICAVSAGCSHSLLLSEAGTVYSFGKVDHGRLGHGSECEPGTPMVVEALEGVGICAISAGGHHSLVLSKAGAIYSFGCGENGQLGHGDTEDQHTPKRIIALRDVQVCACTACPHHSLVKSDTGAIYSFGFGDAQLGHGKLSGNQLTPRALRETYREIS